MDPISLSICLGGFVVGYATSKYMNSGSSAKITEPKKIQSLQDEIREFNRSKLKRVRNVRPCQNKLKPEFMQTKKKELESCEVFKAIRARRKKLIGSVPNTP